MSVFTIPRVVVLLWLIPTLSSTVHAQGCSDAGFCSMGAMKPDQPYNKKVEFRLRSMELSVYRGTTTTTAKIMMALAEMNFSITRKTMFQFKIPYQTTHGNLGKTSGIGDLSLCVTHNIYKTDKFDVNVSLGAKLPTNHADLEDEGKPFPMYYQTSLGTYDGIAGVSLISRDWLIATGIQHPFIHQNENKFTDASDWPDYPSPTYVNRHGPARNLKRGTDVMFRVERNFRFSRLNASVGLLPIYRITQDEITDPDTEERYKLDNTTGIAMSGIVTVGYSFNVRSGVKVLIGRRILHRKINPDGLTRELVTSFSYFYRF